MPGQRRDRRQVRRRLVGRWSADVIEFGDALSAAPNADGRPGAGYLTARRDPFALAVRSTLTLLSGNLYATSPGGFAALLRRRRFRGPGAQV